MLSSRDCARVVVMGVGALQVLRFYACWDDSRRPFGDKMPFVLHYYLSDDTMEVREVRRRNDGRDPWPLLVRRMPIPKKVRPVARLRSR